MTHWEWWDKVGSGMPPLPGEDAHEHVQRVTAECWQFARAAIYEAEAAQLTDELRADIAALRVENAALKREAWTWSKACEAEAGKMAAERERCIAACTEVMNAYGGDPAGRLLSSERVRMQHQLQASGAAQCIDRIRGPNVGIEPPRSGRLE